MRWVAPAMAYGHRTGEDRDGVPAAFRGHDESGSRPVTDGSRMRPAQAR